jgi:hypothetical protein
MLPCFTRIELKPLSGVVNLLANKDSVKYHICGEWFFIWDAEIAIVNDIIGAARSMANASRNTARTSTFVLNTTSMTGDSCRDTDRGIGARLAGRTPKSRVTFRRYINERWSAIGR